MPAVSIPSRPSPEQDEVRISGLAAAVALGGHAVVILTALLLAGRAPSIVVAPTVVGVTLVNGEPGGAAAGPDRPTPPSGSTANPAFVRPVVNDAPSGERIDRLIAGPSDEPAVASETPTDRSPAAAPPGGTAGGKGRAGSSRADQGLGPGEGAEGVDLYAAASLPSVGARPDDAPSGDLWRRVAPCWRAAAPRPATLLVFVQADGRLADVPKAVRRRGVPADPQTLLAERAAVRALQACAPYAGLGGSQWRVEFP